MMIIWLLIKGKLVCQCQPSNALLSRKWGDQKVTWADDHGWHFTAIQNPAQISVVDQDWTSDLMKDKTDLQLTGAGEWRVRRMTEVEGGVRTCWGSGEEVRRWGGEEGLRSDWAQSSGCPDWVSAVSGWPFQCAALREGERERESDRSHSNYKPFRETDNRTQPSHRLILNYRLTSYYKYILIFIYNIYVLYILLRDTG